MIRKVVVAIISTILFSMIISYFIYTPESLRHPNTWYDPFGSALPILLPVIGLAYLLGGIPSSILIDQYVNNLWIQLCCYGIAGFITGALSITIFALFLGSLPTFYSVIGFGTYGIAGSLIFFILLASTKRKS